MATDIFGEGADVYVEYVRKCHDEALGRTYLITDSDALYRAYADEPSRIAHQATLELLLRAHWAATSALGRNHRWLEGTIAAAREANFLAFSACLRAFIEAAGDTHHSLQNVGLWLVEGAKLLRAGLDGKVLPQHPIVGQLQQALIHFQFARKPKKKGMRDHHAAKTAVEYREALERTFQRMDVPQNRGPHALYNLLCQITHPSMGSLLWGTSEGLNYDDRGELQEPTRAVRYDRPDDATAVAQVCKDFSATLWRLPQFAFNEPLFILRVLNHYPVLSLHTHSVEELDFRNVKAWEKISQELLAQGALGTKQPVKRRKIGRNQPCPCGSGRKYKRCCGAGV